jgi:glycogen phosphorylase
MVVMLSGLQTPGLRVEVEESSPQRGTSGVRRSACAFRRRIGAAHRHLASGRAAGEVGTERAATSAVQEPFDPSTARIAYFSMEVALASYLPTYSGGLGVLAGDMLRAAADLRVPMVGVTLIHRKGYLDQELDAAGNQTERPAPWQPETWTTELPARISVQIEGREVWVRAYHYDIKGAQGFSVPVLLLDTDLPENSPDDRALTDMLYGGDARYRLMQEVVLGIGGVRMLRALACTGIERFHMNEGHAALLALELVYESARLTGRQSIEQADVEHARKLCVFTTHTPVASGHDKFPLELAERILGRPELKGMSDIFCCDGVLNMTFLALNLSHYVNGVAKRHQEVSQHMFAKYPIDAITNGIHAATWTTPAFQALFDRAIPGWRDDNSSLRYALKIPRHHVQAAHAEAKRTLFARIRHASGKHLSDDAFTIGFARRATPYKRAGLLLTDPARLRRLAREIGPLQIVYAGKAHPQDDAGKDLIRHVFSRMNELTPEITSVYLEDYDMDLAKLMVSGVDLWLNTPEPPLEASGTSGMKAAVNGVPSLSILDGWWLEGHVEGVTGWAIGSRSQPRNGPDGTLDAENLYEQLERVILPLFYERPDDYVDVMRHAIALTGSFFNTHRMLQQYLTRAYFL